LYNKYYQFCGLDMAEPRQKTHHILLSTDGKNIAVELFDSALWPEKSSADGHFRVRINGKWYCPGGKYTFLSLMSVGTLLARLLSGLEALEEEPPPKLQMRQRVRVHSGECVCCVPLNSESGWTATPPYRAVDGNWWIFVSTCSGTAAYPCHDVEIVKR
jgi:hypothetical protein